MPIEICRGSTKGEMLLFVSLSWITQFFLGGGGGGGRGGRGKSGVVILVDALISLF